MRNVVSWHVVVTFLVLIPSAARADPALPQITPALFSDLDAVVPAAMTTFDVPGAAIALMQEGQVVYAKGFGVRNLTTGQPFTPDTVFRIASTTKSMTTLLVATQVDQSLFDWDTPVHTIYPAFRLPTPELTQSVTVRQLMGMGTGLGENPIELYADLATPRCLVNSLVALPILFPPGRVFHYNNTTYAMGECRGARARCQYTSPVAYLHYGDEGAAV